MKTPVPAPSANPSFASSFFALAGVIEAYQENGAGNIANGWAGIVNQAVQGEMPMETYDRLAANGKRLELVVRQSYEDRNNETN
jgi:hypothetical protein